MMQPPTPVEQLVSPIPSLTSCRLQFQLGGSSRLDVREAPACFVLPKVGTPVKGNQARRRLNPFGYESTPAVSRPRQNANL